MVPSTLVSNSTTAYKFLSGIVCLYKPLGWGIAKLNKEIKHKLCEDLNQMTPPPRREIVEVRRTDPNESSIDDRTPFDNEEIVASFEDGKKKIEVVKGLGFADHPLVTGPQFKHEDIKLFFPGKTSTEISGVHLYGVNKGIMKAHLIHHQRWLRTYLVSGRFGIATENFWHTGRIREKATYGSIKRTYFENFLESVQSSHQRLSFMSSGAPLDSERAYELASEGLVRPDAKTATIVYSLICKEFKLPDFTIEIKAVNEDGEYIKRLVHELGLKLRSVAVCTKIHCTQVGPFGLEDAMLMKHCNVQNFIDNMKRTNEILQAFAIKERQSLVGASI